MDSHTVQSDCNKYSNYARQSSRSRATPSPPSNDVKLNPISRLILPILSLLKIIFTSVTTFFKPLFSTTQQSQPLKNRQGVATDGQPRLDRAQKEERYHWAPEPSKAHTVSHPKNWYEDPEFLKENPWYPLVPKAKVVDPFSDDGAAAELENDRPIHSDNMNLYSTGSMMREKQVCPFCYLPKFICKCSS